MSSPSAPQVNGRLPAPKAAGPIYCCWQEIAARFLALALLVGVYYWFKGPISEALGDLLARFAKVEIDPSTPRIIGVVLLLGAVIFVWRKLLLRDPRYHAPLLVTTILLVGDAAFSILEDHPAPPWLVSLTGGAVLAYSPTVLAILCTILAEMAMGRFYWGKWPHLASAYITGISVGILIKSPALWPFILCGLLSITSKYVLRVGNRHLWNPSNLGVSAMLFLAPAHVASLSVQAGNGLLAVAVIWFLGGLIMFRLKRFHIPFTFNIAFALLSVFRSWVTGHELITELSWMTFPMFQLYIFFMITDPPTTTRRRWSRIVVAILVAITDTVLRLVFKDVHSLYHALFIMAPLSNLIEIWYDSRMAAAAKSATANMTLVSPPLPTPEPLPAVAAVEAKS